MDTATKPKRLQQPVNPHVAALPPYNSGMPLAEAQAISGRMDIARLASNENPHGCSPAVMATLRDGFEPWRYADPSCAALRAALAKFLTVDAEQNCEGPLEAGLEAAIDACLYNGLRELGGSFSAEHGVGSKRIQALLATADAGKIAAMGLVKCALILPA